jgi:hypothetical protein
MSIVAERNESLVRLVLKKLGLSMCRHSFRLVQQRATDTRPARLFLQCDACGAESQGFTLGEIPETVIGRVVDGR